MKQKTQFQIWAINYFLAPFSWSKWTDISTFEYGDGGYLLQGKVNKRTNAKKFRITAMKQVLIIAQTTQTMQRLNEVGLINDKMEYNQ